jgi:chromosome partitioning protein
MRWVICNRKGGVGKTTITCNLAAVSAQKGKRTLVIDLDPQGNATDYLTEGLEEPPGATLADFYENALSNFSRSMTPEDCVVETPFPNLYLLASHPSLEPLEQRLEIHYKMFKLKEALDRLEGYDAIFMDTPPAVNFYTRSALIAGERCLIPFDCDAFSQSALEAILESIREIRFDHNRDLAVGGIVINQFQSRAKLPRRVVEGLLAKKLPVLPSYLSASVKIRESHQNGKPLVYLDGRHKLSQEFRTLFKAIHKAKPWKLE